MARPIPRLLLAAVAAFAIAALTVSVAGATTTARPNHKRTYDGVFERKVSKKNKRWAKRVARCESGYHTPSFFGYMAYSCFLLLPVFGLITFLFFNPGNPPFSG